jgi:hypothetical protein
MYLCFECSSVPKAINKYSIRIVKVTPVTLRSCHNDVRQRELKMNTRRTHLSLVLDCLDESVTRGGDEIGWVNLAGWNLAQNSDVEKSQK